jgi:hypothetical protein
VNDPSIQLLEKFKALQKRLEHLETLETPAIVARYTTDAGQSIPNNSVTIVNFEDAFYNTHNAVTVGASWHFTAPVGGYYAISAAILFSSTNTWADAEGGELQLYKNGAAYSRLDWKDNYGSASSIYMQLSGSDLVYLAATETLDIRVWQISGAALALHNNAYYNYVSIHKV